MSKFFINRPIFASVVSIIIVIAGLVASQVLPIAQYPQSTPAGILTLTLAVSLTRPSPWHLAQVFSNFWPEP